jgi:hypothetical protein
MAASITQIESHLYIPILLHIILSLVWPRTLTLFLKELLASKEEHGCMELDLLIIRRVIG